MSQNLKKSYRDKILGASKRKGREFELDGMKLFFKFPTRRDRRDISSLSTDDKGNIDHSLFETWAVIRLTQVAETKEPLFSDEDFSAIEGLEMGGMFDEICTEALHALLGVDSNGETPDPKDSQQD